MKELEIHPAIFLVIQNDWAMALITQSSAS
jgi:hypothetical protein